MNEQNTKQNTEQKTEQNTTLTNSSKREHEGKFSYFEPITGIIVAVAVAILFLGFPQAIFWSYWRISDVSIRIIPTFYEDIIRNLWLPIILWALFRVCVCAAYFIEKQYTKRLAMISVAGNALALISACFLLISPRIVNAEYIEHVYATFVGGLRWFADIAANPHLVFLVILAVLLVFESLYVVRKSRNKKVSIDGEVDFEYAEDSDESDGPQYKQKKFSYFEPVVSILFTAVVAVIFLGFPQIITWVDTSAGQTFGDVAVRPIPTFYADIIRSLWLPIILWALLRIGVEIAYIIEHRYTKRLAVITCAGDALAMVCALFIFVSPRIVNAEYIVHVFTNFIGNIAWLGHIIANPHIIILVIMAVVFTLDCVNAVIKGKRTEAGEVAYDN